MVISFIMHKEKSCAGAALQTGKVAHGHSQHSFGHSPSSGILPTKKIKEEEEDGRALQGDEKGFLITTLDS